MLRQALPVGLAGAALACALPARGLAAVREVVLLRAHTFAAEHVVSAGSSIGLLGGFLAMKKVMLGTLAVAATAAMLALTWRTTEAPPLAREPVRAATPTPIAAAAAGGTAPAAIASRDELRADADPSRLEPPVFP